MNSVPTPPPRLVWIDSSRGLAILLVVVMHSIMVPASRGGDIPDVLTMASAALTPFRIPMLLILSGYLVPRSLRKGSKRYLVGKLRMVLWPFFVWMAVRLVGQIVTGEQGLSLGYLWFLAYLFSYYVLALLLLRRWMYWVAPLAFLAASGIAPNSGVGEYLFLASMFFSGSALHEVSPNLDFMKKLPILGVSIVALLVGGWLSIFFTGTMSIWSWPFYAFGLLGILAILRGMQLIEGRRAVLLLPFSYLGRHSIVFYCVHFPIVAAITTVLLPRVGAWTPLVNVILALSVAFVLAAARNHPAVKWLFEFPRRSIIRPVSSRV